MVPPSNLYIRGIFDRNWRTVMFGCRGPVLPYNNTVGTYIMLDRCEFNTLQGASAEPKVSVDVVTRLVVLVEAISGHKSCKECAFFI